jgi:hypothetical protein
VTGVQTCALPISLAAVQEAGIPTENFALSRLCEFADLVPFTRISMPGAE